MAKIVKNLYLRHKLKVICLALAYRCQTFSLPVEKATGLQQTVRIFVIILLSRDEGVYADHVGCVDDLTVSDVQSYMSD